MTSEGPRSGVSRETLGRCGATMEGSLVATAAMEGADHVVRYANPAFCRLAGMQLDEIAGRPFADVVPPSVSVGARALLDEVYRTGAANTEDEIPASGRVASPSWSCTAWAILDGGASPAGVMLQATDVTAARLLRARSEADAELRREMSQALLLSSLRTEELAEQASTVEAEVVEARKMEGIGRLAGGIAHDFNSLLTVILGNASLAALSSGLSASVNANIREIRKAAERAATLTSQLLSFARRQVGDPKVADIDALIADLDNVLRRLVDGSIEIVIRPGRDAGRIRIDAGQFGQLLMNLVVNARDSMPDGGHIVIETAGIDLSEREASRLPNLEAGPHVILSVRNDGVGMTAEMKEHAFEPFFTLNALGKGTGLELATCHGIVQQAGGHVQALGSPGEGTTIRILLPRVEAEAETGGAAPARAGTSGRAVEVVLLVDDEAMVREMAALVVRGQGYEVVEATDGEAALHLVEAFPHAIDIIVTDVVMPRMGGQELAERLGATRPGLRVLFMSGYPMGASVRHGAFEQGLTFLQKPYTPNELLQKVRALLDATPSKPPAGG